jgi:hypothetical protein
MVLVKNPAQRIGDIVGIRVVGPCPTPGSSLPAG